MNRQRTFQTVVLVSQSQDRLLMLGDGSLRSHQLIFEFFDAKTKRGVLLTKKDIVLVQRLNSMLQ